MSIGKLITLSVVGVTGLLVLIFGIIFISGYNNLVSLDESITSKYAQVENRLQQRHDTITQMVQTVSGLQEHEAAIYQMIVDARASYAAAVAAKDLEALAEADALESLAVSQLLAVIEDNPQITVSGSFNNLLDNISSLESTLSVSRRDYNLSVEKYNKTVRRFPGMVFASMFNFESNLGYWKIDNGATEVPNIDFGN